MAAAAEGDWQQRTVASCDPENLQIPPRLQHIVSGGIIVWVLLFANNNSASLVRPSFYFPPVYLLGNRGHYDAARHARCLSHDVSHVSH